MNSAVLARVSPVELFVRLVSLGFLALGVLLADVGLGQRPRLAQVLGYVLATSILLMSSAPLVSMAITSLELNALVRRPPPPPFNGNLINPPFFNKSSRLPSNRDGNYQLA